MSELCSHCGGSFASPAELVTHMRKAHRSNDPAETLAQNPASHTPGVTCALCGRTFPTADLLAAHALRPHGRAQRFGRPASA